MANQRDVKLSKFITWVLRHGANEVGISLNSEGYAVVSSLLELPQMRIFSNNDIQRIVAECQKQRFSLLTHPETGKLMIKANQGHTIAVENLKLEPITDPSRFPIVVHGTYKKAWESIKATKGLSRMARQHIHMARGLPTDGGIISGMRTNCTVAIYIDLSTALQHGYKFYISPNEAILCPGNSDGFLPSDYFQKVMVKDGPTWRQELF